MTVLDELRKLMHAVFMPLGPDVSPHAREVLRLTDALAGDEELTREVGKFVDAHQRRKLRADDEGIREYWLKELAAWDGSNPDDKAAHFVETMAAFLKLFAGQDVDVVATPECVRAVSLAFQREAGKRLDRNPGRARMSAGLRAMGLTGEQVDGLLDFERGRRRKL